MLSPRLPTKAVSDPIACFQVYNFYRGRFSVELFDPSVKDIFQPTMQIYINGKERQVTTDLSMAELIQQLELGVSSFAIEVNAELIPRSTFDQHRLQPGDRVEIVQAIGGG
jgi:sulfur carrier protein